VISFFESVLTGTLYVYTKDKKKTLLLASSIIPCTMQIVCCMHNFKRYQPPLPSGTVGVMTPSSPELPGVLNTPVRPRKVRDLLTTDLSSGEHPSLLQLSS
jgi:hypothetical protein